MLTNEDIQILKKALEPEFTEIKEQLKEIKESLDEVREATNENGKWLDKWYRGDIDRPYPIEEDDDENEEPAS